MGWEPVEPLPLPGPHRVKGEGGSTESVHYPYRWRSAQRGADQAVRWVLTQ